MAALNVSPSQVRAALGSNNYLSAVGQTKGALVQLNITASTDLTNVDEFKKLVIRRENGALVRLEDVADVELGADNYESNVRFSGRQAVFMGIWGVAERELARRHREGPRRDGDRQKRIAERHEANIAFDSTSTSTAPSTTSSTRSPRRSSSSSS